MQQDPQSKDQVDGCYFQFVGADTAKSRNLGLNIY
jgi:hypothetical protein